MIFPFWMSQACAGMWLKVVSLRFVRERHENIDDLMGYTSLPKRCHLWPFKRDDNSPLDFWKSIIFSQTDMGLLKLHWVFQSRNQMSFTPDKTSPNYFCLSDKNRTRRGIHGGHPWGTYWLQQDPYPIGTVSGHGSGGLQERMAGQESQKSVDHPTKFIGEFRTLFCNQHEPTMLNMLNAMTFWGQCYQQKNLGEIFPVKTPIIIPFFYNVNSIWTYGGFLKWVYLQII